MQSQCKVTWRLKWNLNEILMTLNEIFSKSLSQKAFRTSFPSQNSKQVPVPPDPLAKVPLPVLRASLEANITTLTRPECVAKLLEVTGSSVPLGHHYLSIIYQLFIMFKLKTKSFLVGKCCLFYLLIIYYVFFYMCHCVCHCQALDLQHFGCDIAQWQFGGWTSGES